MNRAPPARHAFQQQAPKPKPPPMKFTLCKKDNKKKLEQLNIRKGYIPPGSRSQEAHQAMIVDQGLRIEPTGTADSLENEIKTQKVLVVSESWCPFAASAKKMLQQKGVKAKIYEMDLMDNSYTKIGD